MSLLSNKKFLWVVILILVVLNAFLIGTMWISKSQRPYQRTSRPDQTQTPANRHFLKDQLKLSDEQQLIFDSLASSHRANLEQKTDEIRTLREQLVNKMKNQEYDSASENLIQQIGVKQAELELLNFRNFRDIMNICDETQKEAFVGMMHRAFRPRGEFHADERDEMRRGRPGNPRERNGKRPD
ncbi:MAG: periplasmic heavy metal sensor [Cyclobacteriaceae bacterium]|nr:periplasmic heavy metal sensor [Cyclobacteriaceae bacterium]